MIGRISLAAVCLLGLASCNRVISREPWFTAADAQGVPKFRDGLWVSVDDTDCRVDVAKPAERWPDCANASFVRGNQWLAMEWDEPAESRRRRTFAGWKNNPALIANGDPLIGQIRWEGDPSTAPEDVALKEAEAEAENPEPRYVYFYAALRPTRFDEQDNVVAFESWGVACGPLREDMPERETRRRIAADDDYAEDANYVTDRPFPGLTVHEDNCTAESVVALRRAAVLSEPLEAHGTARWVRDGWR